MTNIYHFASKIKHVHAPPIRILMTMTILLGLAQTIRSQSVERQLISAASIVANTGSLQTEGSLGQLAGSALQAENLIITQGFHQGGVVDNTPVPTPVMDHTPLAKVWPNPLTSMLNIELWGSHPMENIRVLDLTGRVQSVKISTPISPDIRRYQVDMEGLASGNYLILLESRNGHTITKIKVTKLN